VKQQSAALYARVSTVQQTAENQLPELKALALARGFKKISIYREEESAVKRRPVFAEMIDHARRGEHPAIVVWSLDRVHRNMGALVAQLEELDRLGVRLLSVREPWLDTGDPMMRRLLIAIFGWIAEYERGQMLERQAVARRRLEKEGRSWGRPRRAGAELIATFVELESEGRSCREIAQAMKMPKSTVARSLARHHAAHGTRGPTFDRFGRRRPVPKTAP